MADSQRLPEVAILLATYNGGRYLAEQIQSIIAQSYTNWKLFIRDDGSTDHTVDIIHQWLKDDDRIVFVTDDQGGLGAAKNFHALMQVVKNKGYQYIFFCDQDDIWNFDKISKQYHFFRGLEAMYGSDTPLLVHSDLEVVDDHLHTIHKSLMQYQDISHVDHDPLNVLLVQNFVTGCTVMVNLPLLKYSLPMPDSAMMHDWWLALCATLSGKIAFLAESTVKYRQHETNEVGAKGFWWRCNFFNKKVRILFQKGQYNYSVSISQASALREKISTTSGISLHLQTLIDQYLEIFTSSSPWVRLYRLKKIGITRQSILTNLLLMYRICSVKKSST